ncbi:SepM family pheromone-processing serine protease [Lacticaseibacillus nasuensis]|uniref:SepM family pheromone-processing serine protease n=1 Tax=Lacticaseibacillus nasuensis TaxID=944671 RepID=UPI0022483E77|nr:SepM family pheromone-processing serine protease [Lacticaseibacillus nasuensis]MCX2456475.1 PDZ domain-containing protein [Lacticaseibacillus nasuensis]
MRKSRWRWAAVALIIITMVGFWPTGKYAEVPGSAESLKPYVKVAGRPDREKGSYMLTTVGVMGPLTVGEYLWAKLQPYAEIDTKAELMGTDTSAEYDLLQRYYIKSAANGAVAAAFKAANRPVTTRHLGIYVMSIMKGSPFRGKLRLGDTITALDGHHYGTADAYVKAISQRKVGSRLTLTYLRGSKTRHATAKLMRLPGTKRAGIGISLTEHTTVTTQPKVTIDAGDIGGPSAGLMFAIQTYTLITQQHYRRGRNIAGTGTIDAAGNVGQIGGIDKKVYMANREGAKIFFAPDAPATKQILKADPTYQNNYTVAKRTAKHLKTKMVVVPVRTLADALQYLRQH